MASQPLSPEHRKHRFGPFEADLRTQELSKSGLRLKLPAMAFHILAALLERPGDLVTREELRRLLWSDDTFIDFDNSLNSSIARLRDALGDSAEKPRFIETLPKRGYRFIAPVETITPEISPVQGKQVPERSASPMAIPQKQFVSARLVAVALLGVVAIGVALAVWRPVGDRGDERRMIVVLPFENLSPEADQEYLSDALTEELITQLARQAPANLGVIARTTAMKYRGAPRSVQEIARELGVDYVVEGSIRRIGEQLRVTVQLIETKRQSHVWAHSYDRQFVDLLQLERELGHVLAKQVATAIAVPGTEARARAPANAAAYEAYLRARFYHGQGSVRGVNQAVEHYRAAIARDPNYALAYAGLARAYIFATRIRPRDALSEAVAAARKAVELDAQLPEAKLALAMVKLYNDRDLGGAMQAFQQAVEMDPGNAEVHFYYAHCLAAMGRSEESIAAARRAQALDPYSPLIGHYVGRLYHLARRYDQANREFLKTIELEPNYAWAHFFLALSYERQGKLDEAVRERQEYWSLMGVKPEEVNQLGKEYEANGYPAVLRRWIQWIEGFVERDGYVTSTELALNYAQLGQMDQAFGWLDRALADHTRDLIFLQASPDYDLLRSDSRFASVIHRALASPASGQVPRTLAVLPFRNSRGNAELDFLRLGLAEMLAGQLSYETALSVRPLASWLRIHDPNPDLREAARQLQVELLLTGSFFGEGENQLLISCELVEMPAAKVLWRGTTKVERSGLPALPDLIAAEIGKELKWKNHRPDWTQGDFTPAQSSAYGYLLRSAEALGRQDYGAAIDLIEKGYRLDKEFGPVLEHLAFVRLANWYQEGKSVPRTELDRVVSLYQKALNKNSAAPARLSLSALYLMEMGRLDDAVLLLREAVRLNPNHSEAHLWLSQAYRYGGALAESLAEAQEALRLDPSMRDHSTFNTYLYLGEYDTFLQNLPQTSLGGRTIFYRGLAYYAKRDLSRAEKEFARAYELEPSLPHAQYGQALRFNMKGDPGKGLKLLQQLERSGHPDGEMRYKLAQSYAALGDKPAAVRALRSAIDARFVCHDCFVRDPLLAPLRSDSEFGSILRDARRRQQAFRKKFIG